tara:strand:+ start:667 stop:930 length:264 start_codon:yes stop_codon:yes gene_type:complete
VLGITIPELEPEEDFLVLEENWAAIDLFLKVQTQWRVGGLGNVFGLCYSDVIETAKLYEIPNLAEVFKDLQVIEITVMSLLNKEGKK